MEKSCKNHFSVCSSGKKAEKAIFWSKIQTFFVNDARFARKHVGAYSKLVGTPSINFFFQNPDPAQQPLDYYYYDDRDTSKYSNRKGPLYDYGDYYEMDDRIRDIRKNDAIFR